MNYVLVFILPPACKGVLGSALVMDTLFFLCIWHLLQGWLPCHYLALVVASAKTTKFPPSFGMYLKILRRYDKP